MQRPFAIGASGSAGSIGSTSSSMSTLASIRQVLPHSRPSTSASCISSGFSTLIPTAPNASASFTKSGSPRSVVLEYLPFQNSFCHCLTIPKVPLFSRTTVTGRSSARDVVISCMTIWNPPSPVMAMTSASGLAALAPIAAGSP